MDSVIDLTSDSETSPRSSPKKPSTSHSATNKKRKLHSDSLPKNTVEKTHSDSLSEACSDSPSKRQNSGKTFYFINVDDSNSDSAFARNVPDTLLTLFRAVHSKSSANNVASLGQTEAKATKAEASEAKATEASESNSLTVGELVEALTFNVADYLQQGEEWDEDETEIMETFLTKLDDYWNFHQPYGEEIDVRAELRHMETGLVYADDLLKADLHSEFVFYRANVDE
jgi:hypothetical protein